MDYDFPIILGMSSSQLTKSIIFQRGGSTNQKSYIYTHVFQLVLRKLNNPDCSSLSKDYEQDIVYFFQKTLGPGLLEPVMRQISGGINRVTYVLRRLSHFLTIAIWLIDNDISSINYPIGSMYAIYTPNISIYTIHGSYGY